MDLDVGAGHTIDRSLVPTHLHEIIPLIEKWAFSGLRDQDLMIVKMKKRRPEELQSFNEAMDKHHNAIREWGIGLWAAKQHVKDYPEQDMQHPYWLFLQATKLREASGPLTYTTPEIEAAKKRYAQERRERKYQEAVQQADEKFRTGDYADCVALLSPFEGLLTSGQSKKFDIAKKRM